VKKDPLDPLRDVMDIALRLLKFRVRSEKDMMEQLKRKGVHREDAAAAVARLKEIKLLDDEALARTSVENGRRSGFTDVRIAQDLGRAGIPRDVVSRALAAPKVLHNAPPTESQRARESLNRRVKRLVTSGVDPEALTRRLAGMLTREGFSPAVVEETLTYFFNGQRPKED
jgi:regulatory protein